MSLQDAISGNIPDFKQVEKVSSTQRFTQSQKNKFFQGKVKKTRYVPMNDTLRGILQQIQKENVEMPFQFKPDYVTHKVGYYLEKAEIQGANCHSLRKTFGCILLQNNIADLYTVSKLLGHSSIRTTERYYVDLIDENYRKSVSGLDALI